MSAPPLALDPSPSRGGLAAQGPGTSLLTPMPLAEVGISSYYCLSPHGPCVASGSRSCDHWSLFAEPDHSPVDRAALPRTQPRPSPCAGLHLCTRPPEPQSPHWYSDHRSHACLCIEQVLRQCWLSPLELLPAFSVVPVSEPERHKLHLMLQSLPVCTPWSGEYTQPLRARRPLRVWAEPGSVQACKLQASRPGGPHVA